MQIEDKAEFLKALNACCKTLNKPLPESDSLKFWFHLLKPYSLEQVQAGLINHMRSGTVFAPVPVDVISFIDKSIDCWVSPDEAWAVATKSYVKPGELEVNTVVTCNEIEQAFEHVRHLLDGGDTYSASRAFKDVYTRIVDVARQKHAKPQWRISLGSDMSQRDVVLGKAVNEGRIALADGRAACPLLACPDEGRDLYLVSEEDKAAVSSRVAGVLAMLQKPRAPKAVADMAQDIAATRDAAVEQARKAAEYVEAQQRMKDEAEAYRMIASMAHLSDGELAAMVRLVAEHQEVA